MYIYERLGSRVMLDLSKDSVPEIDSRQLNFVSFVAFASFMSSKI